MFQLGYLKWCIHFLYARPIHSVKSVKGLVCMSMENLTFQNLHLTFLERNLQFNVSLGIRSLFPYFHCTATEPLQLPQFHSTVNNNQKKKQKFIVSSCGKPKNFFLNTVDRFVCPLLAFRVRVPLGFCVLSRFNHVLLKSVIILKACYTANWINFSP